MHFTVYWPQKKRTVKKWDSTPLIPCTFDSVSLYSFLCLLRPFPFLLSSLLPMLSSLPLPSLSHHFFSFMPHHHTTLSLFNTPPTYILKSEMEVVVGGWGVIHKYIFKVSSLYWKPLQINGILFNKYTILLLNHKDVSLILNE